MASKSFPVVNGPSIWEMHLALFDRPNGKNLVFVVAGGASTIVVSIIMVRQYPDSRSGWEFEGKVVIVGCAPIEGIVVGAKVEGYFDTNARSGNLKISVMGPEPPPHEEYHHGESGMDIIKKFGRVVAVSSNGRKVRIGQKVVSNGRFPGFAIGGTMGIVVGLDEPYTQGKSTDIINVWWENSGGPSSMKFKDLQF